MRSLESTPSRSRKAPIRLLLHLAGEDHPKACTGRRLVHLGRATRIPGEHAAAPSTVVLDPYAPTPLSGADRAGAERGGILVIDCSWNRLAARGKFPGTEGGVRSSRPHRRLPMLIATNPQHYGRLAQLNTVEALSAALYLLERTDAAAALLTGFRGSEQFLPVNRVRLDRYRRADDPEAILSAERELFGEG